MICAHHISCQIGGKPILQDINLSILNGEMLAILGPNGAGKSTLLKILTGSMSAGAGDVTIEGRAISGLSIQELSKRRAVLSQSTAISFPFTARDIVMMGRSPHLLTREGVHDHRIVDDILHRLEAGQLQDRLFASLSGGEQQRIQFGRVLAQIWDQDRACLFLDEPTSALDLKQQLTIVELAKELSVERGFAVCVILHDLTMAHQYADRILLLKQGQIAAMGPPEVVLSTANIATVFDIPPIYARQFAYQPSG